MHFFQINLIRVLSLTEEFRHDAFDEIGKRHLAIKFERNANVHDNRPKVTRQSGHAQEVVYY